MSSNVTAQDILAQADALKRTLDVSFRDKIVESIYADAESIARCFRWFSPCASSRSCPRR